MRPEGLLSCSQEPSTGPYPESDQFSPYHPLLSKIHFIIIHPHVLIFLVVSLFLAFSHISYMHSLLLIHATFRDHLILLDLIILIILWEEYNLWSSSYAVFSNLPSFHLSSAQIFF
jgi:hypothetical protein